MSCSRWAIVTSVWTISIGARAPTSILIFVIRLKSFARSSASFFESRLLEGVDEVPVGVLDGLDGGLDALDEVPRRRVAREPALDDEAGVDVAAEVPEERLRDRGGQPAREGRVDLDVAGDRRVRRGVGASRAEAEVVLRAEPGQTPDPEVEALGLLRQGLEAPGLRALPASSPRRRRSGSGRRRLPPRRSRSRSSRR